MFLFQVDTIPIIENNTSFIHNNTSILVNTVISFIGNSTASGNIPITDNWANVAIAIITLLGVFVNTGFVLLVLKQICQTKKMINITQDQSFSFSDEVNHRLRPWLSFLDVDFIYMGGGSIPRIIKRNRDQKEFLLAAFAYHNFGSFPASNVKISYDCFKRIDSISINEKRVNQNIVIDSGLLMPGQTIVNEIKINEKYLGNENNEIQFYLLLSVIYTNDRIKNECWCNILYKCDKQFEFTIDKCSYK